MLSTLTLLMSLSASPLAGNAQEMRYDNRGRPVTQAYVNDQGPYFFVVDTAAQSSLLSPRLGDKLGLSTMDSGLRINGATGSTQAQMYPVERFSSRFFDQRQVGLLKLPNPNSTPAAGIIGMEYFAGGKLVFDAQGKELRAEVSGPAPKGDITIKGETRDGSLLVVPVKVNGIEVHALIDTGAAVTLANPALLNALGWNKDDPHFSDGGQITGATSSGQGVKKAELDSIELGGMRLSHVPVYFSAGDDTSQPMLTLGVDVLDLLQGYALDFPRGELQIQVPKRG